MMLLYSFALAIALTISAPIWIFRMQRRGNYRDGLGERLGGVPGRLKKFVAGRPVIWIHAVSVGETTTATRLVAALQTALPEFAMVISTTTATGQGVARAHFGINRTFFYPLDFAFAVRPYLRALRPRMVVLMESELWPRMLVECERAKAPVVVVNGRVSDRSLPRYMTLRWLWRPLLGKVRLLLAQSEEDARRWRAIGAAADRVATTGNLKYDIEPPAATPLSKLLCKHLPAGVRVLVCGSTHEGEEAILLDCGQSRLQRGPNVMILVPRHPQRAGQVEQLAAARGLSVVRLSQWRLNPEPITVGSVLVVDSVGELASLYALASVAFIGGSLVAHGGQNPLEAARVGVPVVMGPHYENFREMVEAMQAQFAIQMVTAGDVRATLERLLEGSDIAMGERGRAFAASMAGATDRTVAALVAVLKECAR